MSMQLMLEQNALLYADELAVRHGEVDLTYAQLHDRALRLAHALLAAGLREGDRVAIITPNDHRIFELYFACCNAGFIAVPLNVRLSAGELETYVGLLEVRAVISHQEAVGTARELADRCDSVRTLIGFGPEHGLGVDYERALAQADSGHFPTRDPQLPVVISGTSGTTGRMKGVPISQANTLAACLTWLGRIPATEHTRNLLALPMYFSSGSALWYMNFLVGGAVMIMSRWDPEEFVDIVEREGIGHAAIGPTLLYQIMDQGIDLRRLSGMARLGVAGAPMDPTRLTRALNEIGPIIYNTYGLTESVAGVTLLMPEDYVNANGTVSDRYSSVGRPWHSVAMRVVRDGGQWVRSDGEEIGEIIFRGPMASTGYWNDPEETAEVYRDGWIHSGDLATVRPDGFVDIVDRKKDIIVSGGMNIASIEVERVIASNPHVLQVAVVGVPHATWGEAVHAVMVLAPGATESDVDVVDWCRERLASFKKPQSWQFVDELPVNSTGKVLKRELRAAVVAPARVVSQQ